MIKIDASSLIYSLKLDWIDSLKKLYEDLVITASIYQEVILKGKKKGKPDAFIGEKLINQKIIQVHQVKEKSEVNLGLGEGESETILNAIELGCNCLIDDKKAIRIAESFNLEVINIPITFLEAYKQHLIDDMKFEEFFQKWIVVACPSYEDIFIIKKAKELISK